MTESGGLQATKINLSDYKLMQTLGIGAFGRVRIAKNNTTGD